MRLSTPQIQLLVRFLLYLFTLAVGLRSTEVDQLYGNLVRFYQNSTYENNYFPAPGLVNSTSNGRVQNLIRRKLYAFSPYFVFDDPDLNSHMNSLLTFILPEIKSLNDPNVRDAFELSVGRFCYSDDYYYSLLPFFDSLSIFFINEILKGLNGPPVAFGTFYWKSFLFEGLIEGGFDLKKSQALHTFLTDLELSPDVSKENRLKLFDQLPVLINFLKSKPNEAALNAFTYDIFGEYNLFFEYDIDEVFDSVLRAFHNIYIDSENLEEYFDYILFGRSFSQSYIDRFPDDSEYLLSLLEKDVDIRTLIAIIKKVKYDDKFLQYFSTRDYNLNLFNIKDLLDVAKAGDIEYLLLRISKLNDARILHLYIFLQLVRSGIHNFQLMDPLVGDIFEHSIESFYVEFVFTQSKTPVNMFIADKENSEYLHILQRPYVANPDEYTLEKIKYYIIAHSLKSDDPIPLFFVHFRSLEHFKELITDKFDVSRRYIIDGDFSKVVMDKTYYKIDFSALNGQILSFGSLVKAARIPGLWQIFSTKTSIRTHKNEQISLDKFLQDGIIQI